MMKKIISFLAILAILVSCKKEAVKKPNHLIERGKMVNIMYDLSIVQAIQIQNPSLLITNNITPNKYIFKKYKIDSLQFAQSNIYYASDFKEYKIMFDEISSRLKTNKSLLEKLVADKKKKEVLLEKSKQKLKLKKEADSIKKAKQDIKLKKETDYLKKINLAKVKDSLKKAYKKKPNL